jgi:nitrogen fixation NifU-like protein
VGIDWDKYQQLYETAIKQIYTETVLDHGKNPRNLGVLEKSNAFCIITGPCGDTMAVWLYIENNKVTNISFTTDGCMTSLAAGSMVTELAKGKSTDEALKISQKDVLNALGGLPKDSEHCTLLAANTLKGAVNNYSASEG